MAQQRASVRLALKGENPITFVLNEQKKWELMDAPNREQARKQVADDPGMIPASRQLPDERTSAQLEKLRKERNDLRQASDTVEDEIEILTAKLSTMKLMLVDKMDAYDEQQRRFESLDHEEVVSKIISKQKTLSKGKEGASKERGVRLSQERGPGGAAPARPADQKAYGSDVGKRANAGMQKPLPA